jgi:hypothetical protein
VEDPGQLEILPDDVVLAPGEKFDFGYRAEGSPEVRWTAQAPGKIDSGSGRYTAPKEEGSYSVRASLAGGRTSCAEDEATVHVSGCSWVVRFDGKTLRAKSGDEASFASMPGGFGISLMQKDGGAVGLGRTPEGDGVSGGTMGVSPAEHYGSYSNYNNPKPPMSLTLYKSSDGVAAGMASGQVRVLNFPTEEARLAPFSAEFVIVGDPDASAGSAMDYLGNMGQMLDKMPMLPPGAMSEDEREQLQNALRNAMGAEGIKDPQDAQEMLGGFTTLSCKVK